MKNVILSCVFLGFSFILMESHGSTLIEREYLKENVNHAVAQYSLLVETTERNEKIKIPRTLNPYGDVLYAPIGWDWTVGFFPGSLWYLYSLTAEERWQSSAEKYTEALKQEQYNTTHHDVGFIIGCSYLNGVRMAKKKEYIPVVIQTAQSLSTRFRPNAGIIQSWNTNQGWQAKRGWQCPVIIDNMMNLEILFEATRLSGDSTFHKIAVSHADVTLENHFRADGSSYHVVDYNMESGEVRSRCTGQGYADESAWARGQAWAIYGYTVCYRYTHKPEYLKMAEKIYKFIFTHPNLPKDLVPYWDFDAPHIPDEPRDASAAAITASALYEMAVLTGNKEYKTTADKLMGSLSSPVYRAHVGENHGFLLIHSVGSYPHGAEIDVPLNYADYYFLEALTRRRSL